METYLFHCCFLLGVGGTTAVYRGVWDYMSRDGVGVVMKRGGA